MTSLEKSINLGYIYLTLKKKEKKSENINMSTTFCCLYLYISIYSEKVFLTTIQVPQIYFL